MISTSPVLTAADDLGALSARLVALEAHSVAREERLALVEEENRWLKAQLFGRSSEKTPAPEASADQGWLFNEAEATAVPSAPEHVTIPAHDRIPKSG